MNVQLILFLVLIVVATIGWTAYLVTPGLVNYLYAASAAVAPPTRRLVVVAPPSLRQHLPARLARARRVPSAGTTGTCAAEPREPAQTRDITKAAGLTEGQIEQLTAVLRGEKVLTATTSGKEWARTFAVRPETVYAEMRRIKADIAAEALAREVANPSIEVPAYTPPTLELEHAA